jgi:hypothetical protein
LKKLFKLELAMVVLHVAIYARRSALILWKMKKDLRYQELILIDVQTASYVKKFV